MNKRTHGDTIWSLAFVEIFVVNFVLQMGQYMTNVMIPLHANHLGASAFVVGTISGLFAFSALAIRPISGPAMVSMSKRRLLSLCAALTMTSFILYGLAENVTLVIIARLIHGLGVGVTSPLALAIVGCYLPESKMSSGIATYSLGQALATAIGPSLALKLISIIDFRKTFFIGAAVTLCACLLGFILPENQEERPPFRIDMRNIFLRDSLLPALSLVCVTCAYNNINSYLALFGETLGVEQIGLFFTVYAVALIASRPLSGRIADRYGPAAAVLPGFGIFAVAFLVISLSRTLPMFLLSGVLSAFGYGTLTPLIQSAAFQRIRPDQRGIASNTVFAGMDLGFLIGGPISGAVCQQMQNITGSDARAYAITFRVMIVPIFIGAVIFWIDRKMNRRKLSDAAASQN